MLLQGFPGIKSPVSMQEQFFLAMSTHEGLPEMPKNRSMRSVYDRGLARDVNAILHRRSMLEGLPEISKNSTFRLLSAVLSYHDTADNVVRCPRC